MALVYYKTSNIRITNGLKTVTFPTTVGCLTFSAINHVPKPLTLWEFSSPVSLKGNVLHFLNRNVTEFCINRETKWVQLYIQQKGKSCFYVSMVSNIKCCRLEYQLLFIMPLGKT
jgi:hypothetical protein